MPITSIMEVEVEVNLDQNRIKVEQHDVGEGESATQLGNDNNISLEYSTSHDVRFPVTETRVVQAEPVTFTSTEIQNKIDCLEADNKTLLEKYKQNIIEIELLKEELKACQERLVVEDVYSLQSFTDACPSSNEMDDIADEVEGVYHVKVEQEDPKLSQICTVVISRQDICVAVNKKIVKKKGMTDICSKVGKRGRPLKVYSCPVCDKFHGRKRSSYYECIRRHELSSEAAVIKCKVCLRVRRGSKHNCKGKPDPKKFNCAFCDKEFSSRSNRLRHEQRGCRKRRNALITEKMQ